MRCPSCQDEYEDHVTRCAACGVDLGDDAEPAPRPQVPDARLGVFHPDLAGVVLALLERQELAHETRTRDDGVEVLVDRGWRDELRAELLLSFDELLEELDDELAEPVRALGGATPGWQDPPRGGYVDRSGRMVVEVDEDDDEEAGRVLGPVLLVMGVVLALIGWQLLEAPAVGVAGAALAVTGLFLPR